MISIVDTVMDDAFSAATAAQGWVLTCGNEHDMSGIVGHACDRSSLLDQRASSSE